MEIEKKFSREANAETNSTVDLFLDKSTKELKFLDRYKQETVFATKANYKSIAGFIAQKTLELTEGDLVIGDTYYISAYEAGDDFTNVGAELNEAGQTFVATDTTPTDWTNGSTLINTKESAPQITIFENNLGNITPVWKEELPYIETNELFTEGKTWITPDVIKAGITLSLEDSSNIAIGTSDSGILKIGCSFEIRVYN